MITWSGGSRAVERGYDRSAPPPHPEEERPEVDPQRAQHILREAEASFGERGDWGRVETEEAHAPARNSMLRTSR